MSCVRTLMIGVVICGLMTVTGCGKSADGVSGDSDKKDQARETDELAREELNEPNHAEAREWLKDPSHIPYERPREQVITLVDQFYREGAVKVSVTGLEKRMDSEVTDAMVVELPSGKAARKKIFEIEASWQNDAGDDLAIDVGQKYLRIRLD